MYTTKKTSSEGEGKGMMGPGLPRGKRSSNGPRSDQERLPVTSSSARASPVRAPERLSVRNATGSRAGGDLSARAASAVRVPMRASTGKLTGARAGSEGRPSILTEGRLSSSLPWENKDRDGVRPSLTPAGARLWEQRADAGSGGATQEDFELAAQREVNADIMSHLQHCKADLQREKLKTASLQTDLEAARLVLRKEKELHREKTSQLAVARERDRDKDRVKKALPSVQEDEVLRLKLEADEAQDALLEALAAKTKEAAASSCREQEALAQLELLKNTIVAARQDAARQTRALTERSTELEARLDAACSEAAAAASAAAELQAEMGVAREKDSEREAELQEARQAVQREEMLCRHLQDQVAACLGFL